MKMMIPLRKILTKRGERFDLPKTHFFNSGVFLTYKERLLDKVFENFRRE